MGQLAGMAGGVGVVRVGDLEVTVTPLTMTEEKALRRKLRRAAEDASGDYFTRCAKLLKAMQSAPGAYLESIREITRLTAAGPTVSDDQFFEFRESPAGVALELYERGRKATPGIDPKSLAAVVTDANVDDVSDQLTAVLRGPDTDPPA